MKIVLDTETTNSLDDPLAYDIGWAIVKPNGEVVKTYSYVVAEIFFNEELMASAYFVDKIPQYKKEIENGTRIVAKLSTIRKRLKECCEKYNIQEIYAHNAKFDYLALQTTQRYLTKSKGRWFFPYKAKMCDTLKMSREVLGSDNAYIIFCKENNYLTKRGTPRFTAEIIHRFLSGDNEFVEEHTGLADVLIEKEIMAYCFAKNPQLDPYLWA